MRNLLFKNLTSLEKQRKIVASSEIVDKQGIRSIIKRRFIYIVKEIKEEPGPEPVPSLYVLKERSHKEQREKFFCRIKGSTYLFNKGRLFLVIFLHSLKVTLTAMPQALP